CDIYREINPIMESFAADHDRIRVINPTMYIHSQDDFADCINHFSRNVYYEIAGKICEYINDVVDEIANEKRAASKNIDKAAYDEFIKGLSGDGAASGAGGTASAGSVNPAEKLDPSRLMAAIQSADASGGAGVAGGTSSGGSGSSLGGAALTGSAASVQPLTYVTGDFDVLIVITPDDYDRVKRNYKNIAKYMPGRNIIFIGSDKVGQKVKDDAVSERFKFINENDILPFSDVEAVLKDILKIDDIPRGMTGWYYQQFLKMSYSGICEDEYYMTWDGDTIPCKSFGMFDTDGTPYFDLKQEYCENYFITLGRLFPFMKKCIDKSFISEHMVMKKEYMQEMIKAIETDERLAGSTYYEKILRTIDKEKLKASSFSEFETYGTFVSMKHFGAYKLRNWHSFRYCGNFFDPDTITDEDYKWLSADFEAVSFEKRANRTEEGMALFTNPRYREKLSARQIVEAIQEESDGYKEVWD
nr:DUF6492 family protein [Lachnospiraceae bacterium]